MSHKNLLGKASSDIQPRGEASEQLFQKQRLVRRGLGRHIFTPGPGNLPRLGHAAVKVRV